MKLHGDDCDLTDAEFGEFVVAIHNLRGDCGEIWINGSITKRSIELVVIRLITMIQSNQFSKIVIYVNSPGGLLDEGLSIVDVVELSPIPIWTVAIGEVCSMGLGILASGHRRFSFPSASFMAHEASGGGSYAATSLTDHRTFVNELERQFDKYLNLLARKTKKSAGWWKKKVQAAEYFFGAEEAKKIGLVTDIVNTPEMFALLLNGNINPEVEQITRVDVLTE
jgi:ATP-dependent Clp protease protease subunit